MVKMSFPYRALKMSKKPHRMLYNMSGKEKAFARANELLHAEPVVKDLLKSFDGELQNIQLK